MPMNKNADLDRPTFFYFFSPEARVTYSFVFFPIIIVHDDQ